MVVNRRALLSLGWLLLGGALVAFAKGAEGTTRQILTDRLHHLRIEGDREWSDFPAVAEGPKLEITFQGTANAAEQTLILRQQDVKQRWQVKLNDKEIGKLTQDENDMVLYFVVPPGILIDGKNTLLIEQQAPAKQPDDIRVGEISLDQRSREEAMSEATLEIEVLEASFAKPLPARITLINDRGALQSVGATSSETLAVRPGTIYTANGFARFGVPAGKYTVYAGRGFEYSLDSQEVTLVAGDKQRRTLRIRREVPTEGYVACDTHIHTLTHSGHGDATIAERLITLAGEAIELPIATDHNKHIDYEMLARQMNVRQHLTPVIGNEVTTAVGHFNIFPVFANASLPNHRLPDWKQIFESIHATPQVKAVILNHARDLHSGVRPFGPKLHNAAVGENLEGWTLRANAMEVVNSGAVQTDPLLLFRDWMAMLNRGRFLTPVGSSDSHDVSRHFVGQGRTYIRASDDDPANISVDEAVQNFVRGRVMVSYGLLVELTVDARFGPGELAPVHGDTVRAEIRVLGPHWANATKVMLYGNGQLLREERISGSPDRDRGVLWSGGWDLPKPKHDVHLVAIAIGPAIEGLYWRTAKPYQPTSPEWTGSTLGASGAVWLDADANGRPTPAYDYAAAIVARAGGSFPKLISGLADYDEAVAAQAAHLWQQGGHSLLTDATLTQLNSASPAVQRGMRTYLDAWRETQLARSQQN